MFSAYDIKKIIPRAVMALVGINLSWALMDIFIRAVNALGESAYGLILAPFSGTLTTIDFSGTGNTFSAVLAVALGLAIGSVGLGLIPILGVAVAGATGILLAFAVVMIRRVALIGLIIVAPLAIAAGILPQTESWFKKWWDWFSKLMLMYPFVMAFFALSRVASGIISQGGDSGAAGIYKLGAVAILIAPYFLIGKAFSLAGGAIGKVAGIVNNKDKGLIDKTKKWEAGRVAERRTDARAGSRYGGRNFVTRGINTALRSAANPRTVIGTQEERDARVLAAIQQNAGSMEARNEGAKSLNKEELQLLAGISDETQASQRIAYLAAQRARDNGTDEAHERALLNAAFRTAKQKVGGSIDSSSQFYALQRAVAEGALTPANAAAAAQELSQKLATSGAQQSRIQDTILTQLDGAAMGAGAMAGSVSREAAARRRAGGPPVGPDPQAVENTYRGSSALGFDKLGAMRSSEFNQISTSKIAQTADTLSNLGIAASPDQVQEQMEALIRHRADLIVTRKAAIKANNAQLVNDSMNALDAIDEQIRAAQAAGGINAPDFDVVEQRSQAQADDRIKT